MRVFSLERLALMGKSLAWRWGLTLAVLVAAVAAEGFAAAGPMWVRAGSEAVLRDGLEQAGVGSSGLVLEATRRLHKVSIPDLTAGQVAVSLARAPRAGALLGYPDRVVSYSIEVSARAAGNAGSVSTRLVSRTGQCRQLRFEAGRCPRRAGEVAVSARSVSGPWGWRLGGRIVEQAGPGDQNPRAVTVVGVYRPADPGASYWFGRDYFDAFDGPHGTRLDSMFTADATIPTIGGDRVQGSLEYRFDPAQVRLADVARLRAQSAALQHRFGDGRSLTVVTGLPSVLDEVGVQQGLLAVGSGVVTAQAVVLAWLVLFLVLTDAVDARGGEIALTRLRGLSVWAVRRFALTETVVVLIVAVPLGLAAAWGAVAALARAQLQPGTPVLIPWTTFAVEAVALTGGLAAAVLAARRVLGRTVLEQWRRTRERARVSRVLLPVEIGIAVAAVAGLAALRLVPQASGAVLLAPGLLVTAVALLGVRLIPATAAALVRPTRGSRSVGVFLSVRQVARRPAGLRLAVLLAIAVGLAMFGVAGQAVAQGNRAVRAAAEIGADRSVRVAIGDGVDPIAAVRRVDPAGRWAAAAATWLPDGGQTVTGTLLAVDGTRMAAIMDPARGGPAPGVLAGLIRTDTVPRLVITATSLRATITAAGLTAGAAPDVRFDLQDATGHPVSATAARLRTGTQTYQAQIDCAAGCALVGITWDRPITVLGRMDGTATLTSLEASRSGGSFTPVDARLHEPGSWRSGTQLGTASDRVTSSPDGPVDHFSSDSGGYGGIAYASTARPIPVVGTPGGVVVPGSDDSPALVDAYGASSPIRIIRTARVLPVVGDRGALADLAAVQSQLPAFQQEATWHVLLNAAAPADALQRLRRAGLQPLAVTTERERVAELARQGPALSLLLLLAASFAAAALAMGATAVSITATARPRAYEVAALRTLRVPGRALFTAAALEQAMLLGGAVLLGVPAGIVAALVALPVIPEFASTTPVALTYTPAPLPLVAFTLLFVLLLTATATVAAAIVLRHGTTQRLREAER